MFKGSMVALVTPMTPGFDIDWAALTDLVDWHIQEGTAAIVAVGTTGESATLDVREHCQVIGKVVEQVSGRIPVIAGTGANSTQEAIELTEAAHSVKADACLSVTPYYNKPTQEGLFLHHKAIADAVAIPHILYNVPGRTSVNMVPETVSSLSKTKNIVGIKEASGSLQQIGKIISLCDDNFTIISGDDPLLWPILAIGGKGIISVTANVLPQKVAELCSKAADNKVDEAQALHYELMKINDIMFIDTNPVPAKVALSLMGKMSAEVRQPLSSLSKENTDKLKAVLKEYSLID